MSELQSTSEFKSVTSLMLWYPNHSTVTLSPTHTFTRELTPVSKRTYGMVGTGGEDGGTGDASGGEGGGEGGEGGGGEGEGGGVVCGTDGGHGGGGEGGGEGGNDVGGERGKGRRGGGAADEAQLPYIICIGHNNPCVVHPALPFITSPGHLSGSSSPASLRGPHPHCTSLYFVVGELL